MGFKKGLIGKIFNNKNCNYFRIIKVGNFVINAHMQSKPSHMSIFLKTQSLKSTFSHGLNFCLYKEKSI